MIPVRGNILGVMYAAAVAVFAFVALSDKGTRVLVDEPLPAVADSVWFVEGDRAGLLADDSTTALLVIDASCFASATRVAELPALVRLLREHGIALRVLVAGPDSTRVRHLARFSPAPAGTVLDMGSRLRDRLGIREVPFLALVDRSRTVVWAGVVPMRPRATLRHVLEGELAFRPRLSPGRFQVELSRFRGRVTVAVSRSRLLHGGNKA